MCHIDLWIQPQMIGGFHASSCFMFIYNYHFCGILERFHLVKVKDPSYGLFQAKQWQTQMWHMSLSMPSQNTDLSISFPLVLVKRDAYYRGRSHLKKSWNNIRSCPSSTVSFSGGLAAIIQFSCCVFSLCVRGLHHGSQ